MTVKAKKKLAVLFGSAVVLVSFCFYYVKTHPLVFNESFKGHAHCWKIASGYLNQYAHENDGRFPFHTNGYGDAVLLISDVWLDCFSGPGYSTKEWEEAQRSGGDVPENKCGRVYVQGLSVTNDPEIILLFDKVPTAGDHKHSFRRITAPLVREIVQIGGCKIVRESEWPAIVEKQIELLVAAGITREQAEKYYTEP